MNKKKKACYINSFVQSLYMTKNFRDLIEKYDCYNIDIIFHLQNIFKNLSNKELKSKYLDEIYLIEFKNSLPEPFCLNSKQYDAGEFGKIYFESLGLKFIDNKTEVIIKIYVLFHILKKLLKKE